MDKIYTDSRNLMKSCYEIANQEPSLSDSAKLLKQEFDKLGIKTIGEDKKETDEWKKWSKTLTDLMSTCLSIKLIRAAYLDNGCDESYLRSTVYKIPKNT